MNMLRISGSHLHMSFKKRIQITLIFGLAINHHPPVKKMRRYLIALIVTTLVSFSTPTFSGVAVKEVREMGIDEVIELLSHPDWKERDMAISYGIKGGLGSHLKY